MPGGIWDWAGGLQTHTKKKLNQPNRFGGKKRKQNQYFFVLVKFCTKKIHFCLYTILHLEIPCALYENVFHTNKTKAQKVGRHPQTYTHLTST